MRLVHISDMHYSSSHFVKEWWDRVVEGVNSSDASAVLISGDLTMDGHLNEYHLARERLDGLEVEFMVVPGNHDAKNAGYMVFEDLFGTRKPFMDIDGVRIQGMDSTEPDLDEGQIGRHNYPVIRENLSEGKARILLLHHHVVPVPMTGRERNILADAGDVLALSTALDLDMVLSGHRHLPWTWSVERTLFVTAGTASTSRLKGRTDPSYNLIDIEGKSLALSTVNVRTGEIERVVKRPLNHAP